jgi:GNAT superfamily N-acetyltransferase
MPRGNPKHRPAQKLRVEPSRPEHAERQAGLMEQVYGGHASYSDQIFTPAQFRHHLAVFPEGQFVALDGDRVIGLTVSMRLRFDPKHPVIEPWWETIGAGWLRHIPDGAWMYGVESCVHPAYQGRGVGGALMQARFDTARLLNLRGMVAGSTLLDYQQAAAVATPEEYVQGVAEGRWFDTNLTKQIIKGFRPGAVIPNYTTDPTALGWGAIIIWDNPDYNPAKRPRKRLPKGYAHRSTEVTLKPKKAKKPKK